VGRLQQQTRLAMNLRIVLFLALAVSGAYLVYVIWQRAVEELGERRAKIFFSSLVFLPLGLYMVVSASHSGKEYFFCDKNKDVCTLELLSEEGNIVRHKEFVLSKVSGSKLTMGHGVRHGSQDAWALTSNREKIVVSMLPIQKLHELENSFKKFQKTSQQHFVLVTDHAPLRQYSKVVGLLVIGLSLWGFWQVFIKKPQSHLDLS